MKTQRNILSVLCVLFIAFINGFSATEQVFYDDFETSKGWVRNAYGTDCATTGLWERDDPEGTYYGSTMQLGTTISGIKCLVTGRLAGSSPGDYDIDNGNTTVRSPAIQLPSDGNLTLSFYYSFAHYSNATSADYFRVKVIGNTTVQLLEVRGSATITGGIWKSFNTNLNSLKGQSIYILIEAADDAEASLVEGAIEDVSILRETITPPSPQNEWDYSVPGQITTDAHVGVGGNLSVGSTFFVKEIRGIGHVDPFKIYEPLGTIDVLHIGASEVLASDFQASSAKINGPLYARDITVTLEEFPDYVFANNYKLQPLAELEEYIKENGHLPGIPKQEEVKEKGVDLGALQAKLLEKIEEITLHLIEIKKENQELKEKIEK